jgi:hypothetical protein
MSHHAQSLFDAVLGATGERQLRHPRLDFHLSQRPALEVGGHADVAIRDHADHGVLLVHDRHATAILLPHELGSSVHVIGREARGDAGLHHLGNVHFSILRIPRAIPRTRMRGTDRPRLSERVHGPSGGPLLTTLRAHAREGGLESGSAVPVSPS